MVTMFHNHQQKIFFTVLQADNRVYRTAFVKATNRNSLSGATEKIRYLGNQSFFLVNNHQYFPISVGM